MTTWSHRVGRNRLPVIATVGAIASSMLLPGLPGVAAAATAAGLGPPNTWIGTGQMHAARSGETATMLSDGLVLIAGGGTAAAELFDPATRTFSPTQRMPVAVTDATATSLPDGEVLVAGGLGRNFKQVASAELYNPATDSWTATGPMTKARSGQTATLLRNGQVLVAGGGCNGGGYGCDAGSSLVNQTSAELYNPATGTWTRTGSMADGRQFAAATLLPDGNVLVAGGFNSCDDDFCSDLRTAELYNPATGRWSRTGSMHAAREQFTATLLRNGQVLAAGGLNEGGFCCGQSTYSSAELYSPATGTWHVTASMAVKHAGQTATLLRNGWVLVAGGGTRKAEIYEPQRAAWVSPGAMSTVRTSAAAVSLPGGRVLVAGGTGPDGQPQRSAEEFLAGPGPLVTISTARIAFGGQQVGSVSGARSYQVTNLGSANLLVSGTAVTGKNPGDFPVQTTCASTPVPPGGTCTVSVRFAPAVTGLRTATAAVSDNAPRSPQGPAVNGYGGGPNAWVPVGPMSTPRDSFTATPLPDGEVLVAGGESSVGVPVATAELYNPATRSFSPTGSLHTARSDAAATLLPDGKVLVVGGKGDNFANLASAELYNPATGTWSSTRPANSVGYDETSTLLPDGNVLVTGFGFGTVPAEVYHPATATWTDTGPLTATHFFGTATLLPDGSVLVAGGGTAAAELYDPATNAWTATGSLNTARQGAVAALLTDGDVLVAGGVAPGGGNALTSAELYDPASGTWRSTGSLNTGRIGATATLLPDGTVLVAGGCTAGCDQQPGLSSTELYNPGESGYFSLGPSMTQGRVFHTAALLAGGDVLVVGGDARYSGPATTTAELFTPTEVSVNPASGPSGTQVTVSGSGFYAGETVKVSWDSVTLVGHVQTATAGTFSTKITIPQTAAGTHQISAQGSRSFASATTTFTVTG